MVQQLSEESDSGMRRGLFYMAFLCVIGAALSVILIETKVAVPNFTYNITFHLFAYHEIWILPLLFLYYIYLFFRWNISVGKADPSVQPPGPGGITSWVVAGCVFVVTWLGTYLVTHNYPLSMDEFGMRFQAEILSRGEITAPLAEEWRGLVPLFLPVWVQYHFDPHEWVSMYHPVFSMLLAPLADWNLMEVVPPLLAAGTVILLIRICQVLEPGKTLFQWTAVILLLSSAQFLITAMTLYAMTGHLFFSALWLTLYLEKKTWSWVLLPWVGVLAMGLHQPVPHALFVLPFCLRILFTQHWKITLYVGLVYLGACLLWYEWMREVLYSDDPNRADPISASIVWPGAKQIMGRLINLVYLSSWQHPLALWLFGVTLTKWKDIKPIYRDLILSALISYGFFFFYIGVGGHGWGNRHFHVVLVNFVLVAAAAIPFLQRVSFPLQRWVGAGALVSIFVLFPVHAFQVHMFSKPYVRADEEISRIDCDFVLIEVMGNYYSCDLVRNDPYLQNRPIRIAADRVSDELMGELSSRGSICFVTSNQLTEWGLQPHIYEIEAGIKNAYLQGRHLHYNTWYRKALEAVGDSTEGPSPLRPQK